MVEIKSCSTNFYPELCGVNVIVDPQSAPASDDDRVLIIGQKSDLGTTGDGTLHRVLDDTRGDLFGVGSMLNRQVDEFLDLSPTTEVWVYVLPNSGTTATADVTITGVDTATTSGSVYLWVNGRTYQAAFDPEVDTNDTLAAKLQAVIGATDDSLTVTVAANVVTIETVIKGEVGGYLDVRSSYGRRPDQTSSSEITVDIDVTDATGLPDLSGLPNVTEGFEFVVNPYTDDDSMSYVSDYLCSQWSGGANSRAYGVFYGDAQAASAFGTNTNNALFSYMGIDGALTPGYLESSSYGALAYNQLNSSSLNMAMSMTGQVMPAMLAPEESDLFSNAEKAQMIESGVGYFNVNRVNDVSIGRAVTTYTVKDNGSLDYTLRDVNKPSIIAYISSFMQERLLAKYTGYAFRRDGVVGTLGGQKVATVPAIRNYIISLGQELSNRNLIQDLEGFVESINLTINQDTGCIELTISPELVDTFCCLNVILRTI